MGRKEIVSSGTNGQGGPAGRVNNSPQNGESTIAYPPSDTTSTIQPLAYSLSNAAAALDVSLSLVKELVRTGDLASVRIGRRRLISHRELERFLALREESERLTDRARGQLQSRIDDLKTMLDGLGGGGA